MYETLMNFLALSLMVRAIIAVFGLLILFIPIVVAGWRRHPNFWAITVLDLLIGWTFFGWAIAVAWSLTAFKAEPVRFLGKRIERFGPTVDKRLGEAFFWVITLWVGSLPCMAAIMVGSDNFRSWDGEQQHNLWVLFWLLIIICVLILHIKLCVGRMISGFRRSLDVREYGIRLTNVIRTTRKYSEIDGVSVKNIKKFPDPQIFIIFKFRDEMIMEINISRPYEAMVLIENQRLSCPPANTTTSSP